jgi:hypothetical protein
MAEELIHTRQCYHVVSVSHKYDVESYENRKRLPGDVLKYS